MSMIKTVCPHCGWGISFFSGNVATEMRCAKCGGMLAFGGNEGREKIRTGCPHCGNPLVFYDSVLGEEMRCLKCGGAFAFHDARDTILLYQTYAAVLWGLFWPFLGCWLIKRNCLALNMEDEASHARRNMIWGVVASILALLLIVVVGVLAVAAGFGEILPLLKFLSRLAPWCIQMLFLTDCAMGYVRERGDLMEYGESVRYRSSWLAVLSIIFCSLAVTAGILIFGALVFMVIGGYGGSKFLSRLTLGIAITGICLYLYIGIKKLFVDLIRE